MGYRQKKDGTWEQPAEAERRLLKRSWRNAVAATALGTTVLGSVAFGMALCADSNVLGRDQTDHNKIAVGVMLMVFGSVAGGLGGVPLSRSISRTGRSLDAVRRDIRDNVEVIEGGRAITPEEKQVFGLA